MKKIRIGNDIKIIWSIKTKDGQDYILDGKNLTVKAFRILGAVSTPISFETFGNTLTCWFYGKDQTKLGVYGLVLVENEGREDMHTVDSCDAFQLVARSCDVGGAECGCGNVEVESVELTSTLSADVFSHGVPAGGSAGQLLSKKSNEDFDTEWVDAPKGGGGTVDVVDNLTTADPKKALSANMGLTLNEKFQYKNYLAGKNLDQKGNILDADGWNVTTPIAVVGGTALTFECGGMNPSALCEYDANDNCIDYWGQNAHPRTITTRSNTAYVRLAVPNNPTQDYFVAQNVVLFNKLDSYNIVAQVVENTKERITVVGDGDIKELRHKAKTIYPKTTFEAVIDENGNNLKDRLNEIASGGGEGALLYNTEQTLTDEQKEQIAKNIGQPRERLVLEWKNDQEEVLQPIAYDAETGYFTVEEGTMPSWLAEDGTTICVCINYTDDCKNKNSNFANVIKGNYRNSNVTYCTRISSTQFLLHQAKTVMTKITTPTTVNCELFYLTKNFLTVTPQGLPHDSMAIPILADVSYAPQYGQSGVRKYRIIVDGAACRPCQYTNVWFNGTLKYAQGSQYYWVAGGALGHISNSHFNTRLNIVCKIEYLEKESYGQILSMDANGMTINVSYRTEGWVNPTLSGNLITLWGSAEYRIPVLWLEALQHNATVKVYEIIE